LVDDAAIILLHLQNILSELTNIDNILHAKSLEEAHQIFQEVLPNVVILDLFLKDESGIEFLSFLNKNHPKTKVIILSNHSDVFYKNKCKNMGAHHFFDKSYEFDKIADCLKNYNT
jgi:DNA-binding NarL/FixJ family response regulator